MANPNKLEKIVKKEIKKFESYETLQANITKIKNSLRNNIKPIAIAATVVGFGVVGILYSKDIAAYANDLIGQMAPTPTAIVTYLPEASATVQLPTPENTPIPSAKFYTISLKPFSELQNPINNLDMAPGPHLIHDISFDLGYRITTQCYDSFSNLTDKGTWVYPEKVEIGIPATQLNKVYLIIQAGYGMKTYDQKRIGAIYLKFDDGSVYEKPLVLGQNIRDWARDEGSQVNYAPEVVEAWSGIARDNNSDNGRPGGADLLTIDIPPEYATHNLTSIILADETNQTVNSKDPCIHLLGLSAFYQPNGIGSAEQKVIPTQVPTAANNTSVVIPTPTYDYVITGDDPKYDKGYKILIQADEVTEKIDLVPGDVLFVSGTHYTIEGTDCMLPSSQWSSNVCVYIKKATKAETVVLENLYPGSTKIAVTDQQTIDEVLANRAPSLFVFPNCGNGCPYARIAMDRGDSFEKFILAKDGSRQVWQ